MLGAPTATAAGPRDATSDVLAGRSVTLTGGHGGDRAPGTTTYDGVFSGTGTLTVRGAGTPVLTRESDVTLPTSRQRQSVRTLGGNTRTSPSPTRTHRW